MGCTQSDRELTEVFVQRHEHLIALRCPRKNLFVAWIGAPVSDPLHFMAGPLQFPFRPRPDAAIEQKLQAASSVMAGSMRS